MPIFEIKYEGWPKRWVKPFWPGLPILRRDLLSKFRSVWVALLLLGGLVPAIISFTVLVIAGGVGFGFEFYPEALWITTMLQVYIAVVTVSVVGAGIICEEARARAMFLYFSRPVRFIDYAGSKFLSVFLLTYWALAVPLLLLTAACVFRDERFDPYSAEHYFILLRGAGAMALCATLLSAVVLACSAIIHNKWLVMSIIPAAVGVSDGVYGVVFGLVAGHIEPEYFPYVKLISVREVFQSLVFRSMKGGFDETLNLVPDGAISFWLAFLYVAGLAVFFLGLFILKTFLMSRPK